MSGVVHMRDPTKFALLGSMAFSAVPICRRDALALCTEDADRVTCPFCLEKMAVQVEEALDPFMCETCAYGVTIPSECGCMR